MKLLLLACLLALAPGIPRANAQQFINLDFEAATVAPTAPGGFGGVTDPAVAFPGWTVGFPGTSIGPVTLYNNATLGTPAQVLVGPSSPNGLSMSPLAGLYSALILYGPSPTAGTPLLSQVGTVPSGTRSITLRSPSISTGAIVSLGGVPIPLTNLGGGFYGGDATAFAGQTVALTLSTSFYTNGSFYFDDIAFSSQPVPEPSVVGLALLGGAASLWFARRGKSFV